MPEESDPLQSLIADIIEAESRGNTVDREAFLRQNPEHAESLREFFANHDSMKAGSQAEDVTMPPARPSSVEDATLPPSKPASEHETPLADRNSTTGNACAVGDRVRYSGDYELLEEIARGGMGVVYKARQVNLNRIVALKMILAGQLAGDEDVKRFYTEAEAAANLDHPGIVPIFEIGEHQGQHYFSMGFIEGQSLADKIADGPLAPRDAAEIVIKVCEAMAYAHERGVIHRDLKPANILIDVNGQPKVTDFGLAKQIEADSQLTGTGLILGTPSYMAPEQASGKVEEVGPLADVYALGAILYCLLTGRPPFHAANSMDTLLQVLGKDPISPRQLNSSIPIDIETICKRCLEKDLLKRYSNAESLRDELRRFQNGEPIQARPIGILAKNWRWCRRNPIVARLAGSLAVALVLGVCATLFFAQQSLKREQSSEFRLYAAEVASALNALTAGNQAEARETLLKQPPNLRNWEYFYVCTKAEQPQESTRLQHGTSCLGVSISADGGRLLSYDSSHLRMWDLQSKSLIYSVQLPCETSSALFIGNGSNFATAGEDRKVWLWSSENRTCLRSLDGHKRTIISLSTSPTGNLFATGDEGGWVNIWDASDFSIKHTHEGRGENFGVPGEPIDFSKDGTSYYCKQAVWDSLNHQKKCDIPYGFYEVSAAFSPSGNQIVLGQQPVIFDAHTGQKLLKLERFFHGASYSCYSTDGTRIASSNEVVGTVQLWDSATGIETLKLYADEIIHCLRFSPDDSVLVGAGSGGSIWLWNATQKELDMEAYNDRLQNDRESAR